jgi:hypothetical protein
MAHAQEKNGDTVSWKAQQVQEIYSAAVYYDNDRYDLESSETISF